ncbi:MAG: glycosyl transferase [Ignavibacteria bacterium CG2_30_36_16]|nr:glycosyltransferase family 4 protein [Ignavibacteria bacterium]OIP60944.1 MAG: glycosyl transferase [Ignavibacteria bacterium CG2_30_36_16]PJA99896.1 MAG: glycosyltransferase family 1 protein [Ignavibacteria bacterium CG_4_9_14_3_um_filter_36_18]
MKILYSCLSKSWGGMEMFTLTAVKQLLKHGIHVDLLCLAESRIHIEANHLGIMIRPIKAAGYFHPISILKTAALIRRENYDLIHTQASKDLWIFVPALNLIKSSIPLILTKQMGSGIVKKDFLHKIIYSRITKVIAISRAIKDNLMATVPVTENKIILVHNGIDVEKFNFSETNRMHVRKEFNFLDDEIVVGMLARFSPGKGHEEFLYAAKELNKTDDHLKYLIVGEASRAEDAYAESIKKLARDYNLHNLIFTGFRSDTSDVLSAMDVFVFPSHAEAFGIALAEAMSIGLPSVCSNSEGVLDIAVDNETSYLFKTRDGLDLKNKIEMLINSSEKRSRFGRAARKRAIEHFDIKNLTDKIIELYNSLI